MTRRTSPTSDKSARHSAHCTCIRPAPTAIAVFVLQTWPFIMRKMGIVYQPFINPQPDHGTIYSFPPSLNGMT